MGMGLMAHDGRIAEVDEETKKPVDYDIEEKDKPEVEKQESKVVEASDGAFVTPQAPFYRYESRLNPVTNRYEFVPVDATTGETITQETFEQAQSTRYTPQTVLNLAVQQETECPEGFYFDEEAGVCMPEEAPVATSVVQPDSGGGDEPPVDQPPTPYNYQLSTTIADKLGPLSAEDLELYGGITLADRALSRATEDRGIGPLQRAAMTRQNQLGIEAEDLLGDRDVLTTRMSPTYNLSFDPSKAAFNATTSATISELQKSDSGSTWASDYVHVDSKGNEIDPFSNDADWGSFLDQIDRDFDSLSEVTGASPGNRGPSGVSVSVTTGDGGQTSTSSTSSVTGASDMASPGAGRGGFGGGSSSSSGSESSGGGNPGGSVDSGPGGGFGYAKGGMPTRKVKPRIAMMNYRNKGTK